VAGILYSPSKRQSGKTSRVAKQYPCHTRRNFGFWGGNHRGLGPDEKIKDEKIKADWQRKVSAHRARARVRGKIY
jgi:hypothetical protein